VEREAPNSPPTRPAQTIETRKWAVYISKAGPANDYASCAQASSLEPPERSVAHVQPETMPGAQFGAAQFLSWTPIALPQVDMPFTVRQSRFPRRTDLWLSLHQAIGPNGVQSLTDWDW
jgi:hypothetical protein